MKKTLDRHTDATGLRTRVKSRLAQNSKKRQVGTEELLETRNGMESERDHYTELYDFAPVGYFTLDSGGIILQANLTGAALLGVERSRLTNVQFGSFVSLIDRPAFKAFLEKVFSNRMKHTCEVSLSKEGSQRSYVHIQANVTEDGRECRIVVLNITERRKAEAELQKTELRYRLLHETILQGVIYQDAAGKIISMNPAAVRILGRNPKEFLGHASDSGEHPTLRADGSLLQACDHPSMVALRTGRESRDEVMGVYNPCKKDYRWITVRAVPLFQPGEDKPHQVYIIFDDITERRRTEETLQDSEVRYRRLFEAAQDGILIVNAETGQIDDVNPFLLDMLNYSKEELIGRKLWEIGTFKDIEKSKFAFAELQNNQYIRYEDLQLETKDGRRIDVEFVSNVYLVDHTKVIQCNIRDITKRKRAERAV
ncbi:MAG: PAS domain S-box protein, partial [Deltaproteobacteria bacterium]|nr:PAS domain S-box protein [Deltaproteobacteria bacterium]